jgi:CBS domain containing-hemolysin-like protein
MSLAASIALIAVCLMGQGFFAGVETAFISAGFLRLTRRAREGSKAAEQVLRALQEPESVLSTLLLGTNLFVIGGSTLATALFVRLLGEAGPAVATVTVTLLVLVFGEVIPKSLFRCEADRLILVTIGPLRVAQRLLHPVVWALSTLARSLLSLIGGSHLPGSPSLGREEIRILVREGEQFGVLRAREGQMLRHALGLHVLRATEIMVPAGAIPSLRRDSGVGEARRLMAATQAELLPVWDEGRKRVVGRVDAVDLLAAREFAPVSRYLRPLGTVAASSTIETILPALKSSPRATAVVADKRGQALGLVRLEDVVERILRGPRQAEPT